MRDVITSPGKILFYGGYSILIKGHKGLSLAVVDEMGHGVDAEILGEGLRIEAPQFQMNVEPSWDTLAGTAYMAAHIYLEDKGYNRTPHLRLLNSPIFGSKEEKSGLGSSDAVTVSVVKALFEFNGIDPYAHFETIHKISQWAHAKFFHKTGSGFDIATASAGHSIIYSRYDPDVMNIDGDPLESLLKTVDTVWPGISMEPFTLPDKYKVLYFNIKGGKTETAKAVKGYKVWKKANPDEFQRLMEEQNEVESKAIDALRRGDDEMVRKYTEQGRAIHRTMDASIRKLVPNSDPIEPPAITQLITRAQKIEGVVVGRAPGAGGWDAVAFIVHKDFSNTNEILKRCPENLNLKPLNVRVL